MTRSDQIKALLKSQLDDDNDQFFLVATQIEIDT